MSVFEFRAAKVNYKPHSDCLEKWHTSLKKTCTGYWCSTKEPTKRNIALWRAKNRVTTLRCDFCVCYHGDGQMKRPDQVVLYWIPLCLDLLAIKGGVWAFGHNMETGVFQYSYQWTNAEDVKTAYLAVKVPTSLQLALDQKLVDDGWNVK